MTCIICDGAHRTSDCLFPVKVRRCENCATNILGDIPHVCGVTNALKGYRSNVFADVPKLQFKMRISNPATNGADMFYYEDGCFNEFFHTLHLSNPSTSGLFTIKDGILNYDALKFVKFSFYIAILRYESPVIKLRAIVTRQNGIVFVKCNMEMMKTRGKFVIDSRYRMNTAFILGLKPRSKSFELQIRSNGSTKRANWCDSHGWKIGSDLDGEQIQRIVLNEIQNPRLQCTNCSSNMHDITDCDMPIYSMHCKHCLVVSIDGTMHENPCMNTNAKSEIRRDIFAKNALTLFQLMFSNKDGPLLCLLEDGQFHPFTPAIKLLSIPAESILTVHHTDNQKCIALKQVTFKRCNILIVVKDARNIWRIRFRVVVTPRHGVLVFKLTKTMVVQDGQIQVPDEYKKDTIAVIGMTQPFYAELKVHANADGHLSTTKFDGYSGYIGSDEGALGGDRWYVDGAFDASKNPKNRKFNFMLLRRTPKQKPLSTFQAQRVAPFVNQFEDDDDDDDSWSDSSQSDEI